MPEEVTEALERWDVLGMYEEQFNLYRRPEPAADPGPAASPASAPTTCRRSPPPSPATPTGGAYEYRRARGRASATRSATTPAALLDAALERLARQRRLPRRRRPRRPRRRDRAAQRPRPGAADRRGGGGCAEPTSAMLADPDVRRRLELLTARRPARDEERRDVDQPARRDRPPPVQRGHPPPPAPLPRRPPRRDRHVVRRVGAERRGVDVARRLRRLDAASALEPVGASGIWSGHVAGARRRPVLPLRRHQPRRRAAWRSPIPSAAATNEPPSTASVIADLDHDWGDGDVDGEPRRAASRRTRRSRSTRCTSGRGAATSTPGQRFPTLRRARRPARRPRPRPRLHPRRAAAGHGAPVLRVVGLPDDRLLRPDRPLRHADRPDGDGRPPPPARRRRDPRLGAVALPDGRPRPRPLRRHPPLRARRPAPGLPPRLDVGDLQLRPARGALVPDLERDVAGSTATTSTGCASTPWRRCSTSTTRASDGRVDPQPPTAAARTSRRSTSCASSTTPSTRSSPTPPRSPRSRRRGRWSPAPTDRRRARLRLQVGHGLDARHAAVPAPRPGAPPLPPRRDHVPQRVRVHRALRAAAVARRGRPRQGLAAAARCPATSGSASPTCACCSG